MPSSDTDLLLRAVVDAAIDAIIVTDQDGRIRFANAAAERLFGYRSDEVMGNNVKLLIPSPYRDAHDDYLERYRQTG